MRTQMVQSSLLVSAGYDRARRILEIEFLSKAVYQYFEVSEDIFDSLIAADSKGSYFNSAIRGRYPFSRLS